jgi:hypothetical protein
VPRPKYAEAEVVEELPDGELVDDEREDAHALAAPGADEWRCHRAAPSARSRAPIEVRLDSHDSEAALAVTDDGAGVRMAASLEQAPGGARHTKG